MIKIKLSIPEPCHENWNNMTPTEKGKHCAVCNKEVFDMTKFPEEDVAEKISQLPGGDVCARIPDRFLNKPIQLHAAGISGKGKLGLAGAVITAAAFTPMISVPDTDMKDLADKNTIQLHKETISVNGTIVNENGEIISGAKVVIRQNEHQATVYSLANGRFAMNLDPLKINSGKAVLTIEKSGFVILQKIIEITGNLENGKFTLAALHPKEELNIIKECSLNYIEHSVNVGQLVRHVYDEKARVDYDMKLAKEESYRVTGGAVVSTFYMDEMVAVKETLSEEEKVSKVVAVFENPNQLKTFPNPTTDFVNLEMTKEGNYTVYVFDLTGKMIVQENFNSNKSFIDLSSFERGNYIVKVTDNDTQECFDSKVVLMR